MLELRSVTRRFGGMMAVDGVSLTVARGEIAGLIGPNGAGKTTLFNLVAGSLAPTAGAILLEGQAIESEPAYRRLARGLGRTFQIPRPFPEMSLLENLLVAAPQQTGERLLPNFLHPAASAPRRNATSRKPGNCWPSSPSTALPISRRGFSRADSASCWSWRA